MQTSVCLLVTFLAELAFSHHIGFNFSPNRNRTVISFSKEPEEYKKLSGSPKGGWVDFTDAGSDIKDDQLLEWIKKQTSGEQTPEFSFPEDYTLSKSQEIGSWSHVIRQEGEKGSYSYGEGQGSVPTYTKINSKNNGTFRWTQVYHSEPTSTDSKEPNPWYQKSVSNEKYHGWPLPYSSEEFTSWPRGQVSVSKFQMKPKVESKPKVNEPHWIWNHKLAKLEKVSSNPQANNSKGPSKPNSRPPIEAEAPRSKPVKATPSTPSFQPPASSSILTKYPKAQAGSQFPWKQRGVLRQHGKVQLYTHEIPVPYEVKVEKEVRYPVHVPEERPVPYTVYKPYPVLVEKKVPFPVKVNVPYPVPVYKEVKVPVKVKEERLVPFDVHQTVPVYLEKTTGLFHKQFTQPKVVAKESGKEGSETVTETSPDTKHSPKSKAEGSEEKTEPPRTSYELTYEEEHVSDDEQEKGWEDLFTSQLSSIALPPQINGPYRTVEETQEEEDKPTES